MKPFRCPFIIIASLFVAILTGCGFPQVSKEQVIAAGTTATNKHSGTVLVSVSGIEEPSWLNSKTLQEAVVDSINQAGLFTHTVTVGESDYHLDVLIVKLDQSNGITVFTGTTGISRMMWTLTRVQDHKQVFQDEIVTEDTSYQPGGVTRVRAAMSGCIRKNIEEAIERIDKSQF